MLPIPDGGMCPPECQSGGNCPFYCSPLPDGGAQTIPDGGLCPPACMGGAAGDGGGCPAYCGTLPDGGMLPVPPGAPACPASCGPGNTSVPPPGMPHCQGNLLLQQSPIDLSYLLEILPLGSLSPTGGHVYPNDHNSFVLLDAGYSFPIVAPADVTISLIGEETRTGGPPGTNGSDFTVDYYPCSDVEFFHFHITTLSDAIMSQMADAGSSCGAPGLNGPWTVTECWWQIYIPLTAGTQIGTVGLGLTPGADFGAIDTRLTPAPYIDPAASEETGYETCPFNYLPSNVANPLLAIMGAGGLYRTVPPLCGVICQDLPNTAQGRWVFQRMSPTDTPQLALVHSNVVPSIPAISMGDSVPSIPNGLYEYTAASAQSPPVNIDFSEMTPDGTLYCLDDPSWLDGQGNPFYVLLTMPPIPPGTPTPTPVESITLQIEGFPGATCPSDPSQWALDANAVTFTR